MTTPTRAAAALGLALVTAVPFLPAMAASDQPASQARTEQRRDDDRRSETRRTQDRQALASAAIDAAAAAAAVRTAGYGPVREIEWDNGGWDVKATDAQGQRVTLRVDAATGAVTRARR